MIYTLTNLLKLLTMSLGNTASEQIVKPAKAKAKDALATNLVKRRIKWARINCVGFGDGYDHFYMREDVARRVKKAFYEIEHEKGVPLSVSGGRRNPRAKKKKSRAAASNHTLGRAFDLWVYGGGSKNRLHFVIEKDPDALRKWIVWGLSSDPDVPEKTISAYDFDTKSTFEADGRYVNLTRIFKFYGLVGIPNRGSFPRRYGAWEWWHFEDHTGLIAGVTRYIDELRKVWSAKDLRGSRAEKEGSRIWNGSRWEKV